MTTLTPDLFGNFTDPSTDPEGTDSRRQGDDNIRALASSLKKSFPALTDQAVTLNGAQLSDAAQKSTLNQFSFVQQFAATEIALQLVAQLDQEIMKTGNGTLSVTCGNGNLDLNAHGGDVRLLVDDAELLRANQSGAVVITGDFDVSGDVSIAGVVQPSKVSCVTVTVPAGVGNPCVLTNASGGATGWTAIFTNATTLILTHSLGHTVYVPQLTRIVGGGVYLNAVDNNTFEMISVNADWTTGHQVSVTVTEP